MRKPRIIRQMLGGVLLGLVGMGGLAQVGLAQVQRSPSITQGRSFLEWCQDQAQLSPAQRQTMQALLTQAGTPDCTQAATVLENFPGVLILINQGLTDLSPLGSLPNLKGLDLSFNQVRDLSPLAGLTQLQFLLLGGNHVEDVAPLAGMTQLGYLVLDQNRIQDLSPLAGLASLNRPGTLQATNNPIVQKQCPLAPTTVCIFSDDGADGFALAQTLLDQGDFASALEGCW